MNGGTRALFITGTVIPTPYLCDTVLMEDSKMISPPCASAPGTRCTSSQNQSRSLPLPVDSTDDVGCLQQRHYSHGSRYIPRYASADERIGSHLLPTKEDAEFKE
jgi:hypothetical protein